MPQNTLMVRFRVYAPNGALQGSLPHPLSWEMGVPLNDMPSLTLTYPLAGAFLGLLTEPMEIAVEIRDPVTGNYAEYPGCRFINLRRSQDLIEHPGSISLTLPHYGWQLRKVRFIDARAHNNEGRRPFTDSTPGFILGRIIDEARDRGNIPGLTRSFTGVIDSIGAEWVNRVTAEYDLGQDAWSMLDAFARQGILDWQFTQRELDLYNPDTFLRRNLATDSGLIFHPAVDHMEEPAERTWEEVAPTLLVVGDENSSILVEAETGVDSPWGNWEEFYSASGVSNEATLLLLARRVQDTRAKSRLQLTKRLAWRDGSPVPFVDYRPGDMVRARTDTGNQLEPVRVHQITLSGADEGGAFITLTLNDRFTDRNLKTERWLNRLSGTGGPGEGGGSGAEPKPPKPEQPEPTGREPAVPQNVVAASTSYFDASGNPVGNATLTFNVVVTDTQGDRLTPDRYELYARRTDQTNDLAINATVQHPEGSSAGDRIAGDIGPLDAGFTYRVAVRAISQAGFPGDWSPYIELPISYPTDPPPIPSAPILSTKLATVKIEWDGMDADGVPMPARFREVQVELSLTGSDPWTHVGEIFRGGSALIITGQDSQGQWGVGSTLWFRLRSRDSASNISEPGLVGQIVVQGVTGPDIVANSITTNHIIAGAITAEKIKAHSVTVDRLSVGDTANIVVDPLLTDEGDPDPNDPTQTVGGLNRHRQFVAEENSAEPTTWVIDGRRALMTNAVATDNFNRFGLVNNVVLAPDLVTPGAIENVGLVAQVIQPSGAATDAGNLKGRIRVQFSLNGAVMPGGAQTQVSVLARFYGRAGEPVEAAANIIAARSFTQDEDVVIQSLTGSAIPPSAAGVIPYVYVTNTGGVPAGVTVAVSEFEVWQENSVFIGDGMIRAPLIQANAIVAEKIDANAITAKHTIRSSLYIMQSRDGEPTFYISNNANYNGQAGIRWEGPSNIEAPPRIFMVNSGGTGGWDPNALVVAGPEAQQNDTGRVDMQLAFGITNSYIRRQHGTNTENAQGVYWRTNNSTFHIMGQMQGQNYTNDMFRGVNFTAASNQTTWSFTWGTVNWVYVPVATPAFVDTNTNADNATCLVTRREANGIRVVSNRGTTRMDIFAFAGGSDV